VEAAAVAFRECMVQKPATYGHLVLPNTPESEVDEGLSNLFAVRASVVTMCVCSVATALTATGFSASPAVPSPPSRATVSPTVRAKTLTHHQTLRCPDPLHAVYCHRQVRQGLSVHRSIRIAPSVIEHDVASWSGWPYVACAERLANSPYSHHLIYYHPTPNSRAAG
jgi:hypothetical protein